MSEVCLQYGISVGDHIDHVDQITMYNEMSASQEHDLDKHVHAAKTSDVSRYDCAAELRDSIIHLHDEVGNLQRVQERKRQTKETRAFGSAASLIKRKTGENWDRKKQDFQQEHDFSRRDLHRTQRVETAKLSEEIDHLPPKIFKASCTLLAMRQSEASLCQGRRFAEAKVVKSRADKLETLEHNQFIENVAAAANRRRKELKDSHQRKSDEHESFVKRNEWSLKRSVPPPHPPPHP
jgi:hypothetical protein